MRTYSEPTVILQWTVNLQWTMNSEPTVLNRKEKQRSREYREIEKLVCVKGGVTNYLFPCFIPGVHLNLDKPTLKIMLRMKKMRLQKKPEMVFFGSVCFEKYNLVDNQIFKPQESCYFRLSKKFTPPFFGSVIYNLYQVSYQSQETVCSRGYCINPAK